MTVNEEIHHKLDFSDCVVNSVNKVFVFIESNVIGIRLKRKTVSIEKFIKCQICNEEQKKEHH